MGERVETTVLSQKCGHQLPSDVATLPWKEKTSSPVYAKILLSNHKTNYSNIFLYMLNDNKFRELAT
jgi:hypothetical protein